VGGAPSRKIMEIPGGRGSTVKPPGMENPGGWGVKLEKTLCGGYRYFLEPHNRKTESERPKSGCDRLIEVAS